MEVASMENTNTFFQNMSVSELKLELCTEWDPEKIYVINQLIDEQERQVHDLH